MGDFNITFENRDSTNRNADIHEINSRRIIKDIMFGTKAKSHHSLGKAET